MSKRNDAHPQIGAARDGWDDAWNEGDWEDRWGDDDPPGDPRGRPLSAWDAMLQNAVSTGGVAVVSAREWEGHPQYAYTVGLSAYGGHPELLMSGVDLRDASEELAQIAGDVRSGRRLRPFEEMARDGARGRRLLVPVADPAVLLYAQEHFADPGRPRVTALQVVWADDAGHWPWEIGWRCSAQELFGAPLDAVP